MTARLFETRRVVLHALQWTGENLADMQEFATISPPEDTGETTPFCCFMAPGVDSSATLFVRVKEEWVDVDLNDWVAQYEDGFIKFREEAFDDQFTPVVNFAEEWKPPTNTSLLMVGGKEIFVSAPYEEAIRTVNEADLGAESMVFLTGSEQPRRVFFLPGSILGIADWSVEEPEADDPGLHLVESPLVDGNGSPVVERPYNDGTFETG